MPESNGFKRLAGGESKLCPFLTDLENEFCVCNSQDLCKLFQDIYIFNQESTDIVKFYNA